MMSYCRIGRFSRGDFSSVARATTTQPNFRVNILYLFHSMQVQKQEVHLTYLLLNNCRVFCSMRVLSKFTTRKVGGLEPWFF